MQVNIAKHDCTIIWDGVYYFALYDYPHISQWELRKLLMFVAFEKQHGRQTEIIYEDKNIADAVNYALAHPETVENTLLPYKIIECTYCKHDGCLTRFVCHTATPDNAKKILASGKLLSAGDYIFALEYEPWNGGHVFGDGHHISFFFRCELLNGSQITTSELPDIDPLNPVMVSQPIWLPVSELPAIELLPHINKNLLQYFKTGVFKPLFFDEPYENNGKDENNYD